jgi:hypothetical protein
MGKRYCAACEREKAKLPTYRDLAIVRAKKENKVIIIYFDEEDKKFKTMDHDTSRQRGVTAIEYFIP